MTAVRAAVLNAGMVPLVVAPTGGTIGSGDAALTVQRSYVTARSVEFDAVLRGGDARHGRRRLPPAGLQGHSAARAAGDHRPAGEPAGVGGVPARQDDQCLGGRRGRARRVGHAADAAGVVVAASGTAALEQLTELMGAHRVWERFTTPAADPRTRRAGHRCRWPARRRVQHRTFSAPGALSP